MNATDTATLPMPAHSSLPPQLTQALMARIHSIPCVNSFNLRILRLEPGLCEATMSHDATFNGIYESFHGGLLMATADMAACFAIMTHTGPDQMMATTDMGIRFLGPCLSDVRAVAKVIKLGRTLCPCHVDLYDANDKLVAVANATYMRLEKAASPTHKP